MCERNFGLTVLLNGLVRHKASMYSRRTFAWWRWGESSQLTLNLYLYFFSHCLFFGVIRFIRPSPSSASSSVRQVSCATGTSTFMIWRSQCDSIWFISEYLQTNSKSYVLSVGVWKGAGVFPLHTYMMSTKTLTTPFSVLRRNGRTNVALISTSNLCRRSEWKCSHSIWRHEHAVWAETSSK